MIRSNVINSRDDAHRLGLWHHAVQANIIRLSNKGNLQILIQKRSDFVDIGKSQFDQSLATQFLYMDKSLVNCLYRGLKEELGLNRKDIEYIRFLPKVVFKISKKYKYDPKIINNELIHLFLVKLRNNTNVIPISNKVKNIKWISWDQFTQRIKSSPNKWTKTSRFYTQNIPLANLIKNFSIHYLKNFKNPNKNTLTCINYISLNNNYDFIINETNKIVKILILDSSQHFLTIFNKSIPLYP